MDKLSSMRKMDYILIVLATLMVAFIICMIVLFACFQSIPDTLCTCVLGSGSLELACTTVIKVFGDKHTGLSAPEGE